MLLVLLLVIVTMLVAYGNGANDNFKGVATLHGSGTTSFRTALIWANATTLAGAMTAMVFGLGLAKAFGGNGLVPDAIVQSNSFLTSVGLAAAATVLLATRLGLPISTTHALMGALVGAGLVASPGAFHFGQLGGKFVLPLILGPLLAVAITVVLYPAMSRMRGAMGVTRDACACVGATPQAPPQPIGMVAMTATMPGLKMHMGKLEDCREEYSGEILGLSAHSLLTAVHFLSAGAVSFARGLNDAPKIAALALAGTAIPFQQLVLLVAGAMLLGGILGARRVARTMSHRITTMNDGQGCTANLVTAALVTTGSTASLPLSTTHVSCGALFGLGVVTGGARRRMILGIVASWLGTLPLAAALAAICYLCIS